MFAILRTYLAMMFLYLLFEFKKMRCSGLRVYSLNR